MPETIFNFLRGEIGLKKEKGKPSPRVAFGWETEASFQHPERNEDSCLLMPDRGVFAVFDGVGGEPGGKEAAISAENAVRDYLSEQSIPNSPEEVQGQLAEALRSASQRIRQTPGAGSTTAVIAYLWENPQKPEEQKLIVANIGNSRAYIFSKKQQEQERVTLDDSLARSDGGDPLARQVQEAISNCDNPADLPDEIKPYFEEKDIISRALDGNEPTPTPTFYVFPVEPGDRILLCSDGITGNLTDPEIRRIILKTKSNKRAAKILVKKAQKRSLSSHPRAQKDDMTAVVFTIPARPETSMEPEKSKRRPKFKIESGSQVVVQRSSGAIETGWIVASVEEGKAVVIRQVEGEKGKIMSKEVPLTELLRLNKPVRKISDAKNFGQLYRKLEELGGVQDSRGNFISPASLIYLIEEVRAGRQSLTVLTRTAGIREKAAKLLEKEQRKNKRK
ncbi:serine/threonine-protein phosphatase [Candidatus Shapirobacteria bacterium]|nr:serine/threonine-protein phosphatase [Candidatus Shapirobacteria bacterium]